MQIETQFLPVMDIDRLEHLFTLSQHETVILFNHDKKCPISAAAYRQMLKLGGEVPMIDVTTAHEITREIEKRTEVKHESPQVIILRGRQAAWSASHHAITVESVRNALQEA